MRRLATILLLLVFAFNLFGYRLFVSFMVKQADHSLELALDENDYNESELISVKKSINLPYYNNTKDFKRAYGEVEVNGVYYQYVKSRIYNDSLEMLCIPNVSKQQLLNAKDDFTQTAFDLQKDTNKKTEGNGKLFSFIKLLSEYDANAAWQLASNSVNIDLQTTAYYKANAGTLHKATIEQPPDTML
ncbi:hypothetical protein [Ferruginibacter sp.]